MILKRSTQRTTIMLPQRRSLHSETSIVHGSWIGRCGALHQTSVCNTLLRELMSSHQIDADPVAVVSLLFFRMRSRWESNSRPALANERRRVRLRFLTQRSLSLRFVRRLLLEPCLGISFSLFCFNSGLEFFLDVRGECSR